MATWVRIMSSGTKEKLERNEGPRFWPSLVKTGQKRFYGKVGEWKGNLLSNN
jgi:hypothetical protein